MAVVSVRTNKEGTNIFKSYAVLHAISISEA